jgi:uncharacterized protein (TIGR00304 family)
VEDETLIESILPSIGVFTIFIGFLTIMIGIALGVLQSPELRQDYPRRTESSGKENGFGNTPDSGRSPDEKSPDKKSPAEKPESKVKGGGVIMLGPIPIIFGSDNESAKTAAILAIILMLLSLLIFRSSLF